MDRAPFNVFHGSALRGFQRCALPDLDAHLLAQLAVEAAQVDAEAVKLRVGPVGATLIPTPPLLRASARYIRKINWRGWPGEVRNPLEIGGARSHPASSKPVGIEACLTRTLAKLAWREVLGPIPEMPILASALAKTDLIPHLQPGGWMGGAPPCP